MIKIGYRTIRIKHSLKNFFGLYLYVGKISND